MRTDAGEYGHLSGVTLDAQNRFQVPNSTFAPDVTNYIRIKQSGDATAIYSPPVAVTLDSTVTPTSDNQVKSLAVSRVGTNIVLSWGLGTQNNKQTKIYFRRQDTGAEYVLTPVPLSASVNALTLNAQALEGPCISFFAREVFGAQTTGPSRDPMMPTSRPGIGPTGSSDGSPCTGTGGGSPGEPANPSGPAIAYANFYQHRDHLGNLRIVTDDSGKRFDGHDYLPFGAELAATGKPSIRLFTGHQRDVSTGLDYMLARYHSPALGRFLSVDPGFDVDESDPQSWNLYGYVRNNPVDATDPDGKQTLPPYVTFRGFGEQLVAAAPTAVPKVLESAAHDVSSIASKGQWTGIGIAVVGLAVAPELVVVGLAIANTGQNIQTAADLGAFAISPSQGNKAALAGDTANYALGGLGKVLPGTAGPVVSQVVSNVAGGRVQSDLANTPNSAPAPPQSANCHVPVRELEKEKPVVEEASPK